MGEALEGVPPSSKVIEPWLEQRIACAFILPDAPRESKTQSLFPGPFLPLCVFA
jgi:hypothetical protein